MPSARNGAITGCTGSSTRRRADVAFVGVGNLGPHCPLYEDGFITEQERDDDRARRGGRIARRADRCAGQAGRRVDQRARDERALDTPPKRPTIAFAGGTKKRDAVIAARRLAVGARHRRELRAAALDA
jgi:DNA-binding transcriptional regulator LsrR (DeoR family)